MNSYLRQTTLLLLLVLASCGRTREQALRSMAHDVAAEEHHLRNRTVAILTPEPRGQSDLSEAVEISEVLTHEIVSSSKLRVVERNRLGDVLKEQELAQSGITDPAAAAKLGRALMVDAVLIGTVTGKPGRSEVFLRLVDSETAVILRTARGEIPASRSAAVAQPTRNSSRPISLPVTHPTGKGSPRRSNVEIASGTAGQIEGSTETLGRLVDVSYRKPAPGGYHQVIGRVENRSLAALNDARVSLQLYNAAGELVGGSACLSPDRPIFAGQKLPFSCLFKAPADFHHFEASLDTSMTIFVPKATELSATGLKFRRDAGSLTGDYQLSGILRNDSETAVTYPRVLVSLFDAAGRFIGSSYGFTVKKELAPGESSPFAIAIHAYALQGKAVKYEAFYSALPTRR